MKRVTPEVSAMSRRAAGHPLLLQNGGMERSEGRNIPAHKSPMKMRLVARLTAVAAIFYTSPMLIVVVLNRAAFDRLSRDRYGV
jgi:hypothetical protein